MWQIAEFSTPDETKILNELLSENKEKYSLYDIFKYLHFDITYNGNRGYLSISQLGIEYTSLKYNYTLIFFPYEFIQLSQFAEIKSELLTSNSIFLVLLQLAHKGIIYLFLSSELTFIT